MGRGGLLSRLTTGDGNRPRDPNDIGSILEHLRCLLNTRTGSSLTVPDFATAHIADIHDDIPEAIETWRLSIVHAINTYEPRLTGVEVIRQDQDTRDLIHRLLRN